MLNYIEWPDLTFPPINLWNLPYQSLYDEELESAATD